MSETRRWKWAMMFWMDLKVYPLFFLCVSLGVTANCETQGGLSKTAHELRTPSDGPLFYSIPPKDSGLIFENSYDDRDMWSSRYQEFQSGAIGTGIAAGDIDGDGWTDLYIVSKTGENKLFRQEAPLRFVDITEKAGVQGGNGWGSGASFADVDNDGDLDLYVCQIAAPNLLYRNDGQGVFEEIGASVGLDISSGSVVGAFEDYDRDGDLDLFLVTNVANVVRSPKGEPDLLLENDGSGRFADVTERSGIASLPERGHSATWWDANGDGWSDLYIANDFEAPDHLYLNRKDGSFSEVSDAALPHTAWFSMGADFGDVNNDGLFDFLVADMAGTSHLKQKVAMGDMGGLIDYMDTLPTPQYMANALFVNNGSGRFLEAARLHGLSNTDWTWSVRFEDLDNDGWLDLHVTNGMVRSFNDSDLTNRIKRARSRAEVVAIAKNSPPLNEANLAFRNTGDWAFEDESRTWGLDHVGVSFGSVLADFDRDGDIDIAYSNFEGSVSLYRNNSQANSIAIELKGRRSNRYGIGTQVVVTSSAGRQIRQSVVARGALSSAIVPLHFGLGSDEVADRIEVSWPSGAHQVFESLPANYLYSIIEDESNSAITRPAVGDSLFIDATEEVGLDFRNTEEAFDDMLRQPLLPNRMNTLGGGLAWGDADGDGDSDLYLAGAKGQLGALYLNDGDGRFGRDSRTQPWMARLNSEEMAPLWVDSDGDGDLDLYVSSGGVELNLGDSSYSDHLYINRGDGIFDIAEQACLPEIRNSASVVASADYDRDGDLDLFVGGRVVPGRYPIAPQSSLLENEGGTFREVSSDEVEGLDRLGMVTSAVWSDANGDGWLDLLVAGEWEPIRLFVNRKGVLKEERSPFVGFEQYRGWWNALEPADVDGDGDMDYVACNLGLNTKYHATRDQPIELYYGDFEGKGEMNIVEAEYEGNRLYPIRGKSCSTRAMPSLGAKFATFRAFGSALLSDIYQLDEAKRYQATEFAHGVFINDGNARFHFKPLPRSAQVSIAFGVAARDFNGDGFVDIVLGQNFYGPQVETGRFDGGQSLLLLGDGSGEFRATLPSESGIGIVGELRGIAVSDFDNDGWADLTATRIQDRPIALRNSGQAGNHSFSVRLLADQALTTGAKIFVYFRDGRRRFAETHLGSGYLSQSESLSFFGYAEGDRPESISVTWSTGNSTNVPWRDEPCITIEPER